MRRTFVPIILFINHSIHRTMNERTTWKTVLTVLLAFQILVALSLAAFAVINFPMMLGQFGIQYHPDLGPLRLLMTYNLLLSASICLWSVLWIRKGNIAGIHAGTTVGVLMFVLSMVTFIIFDRTDIFYFDGIRSFLMIVFGVLAYREQKKYQTTVSHS